MNKAVFLDRDGTLIQDRGYICDFSQVGFFPFAAAAVRTMTRAGYLAIVASNQSAVARGICSEPQISELHRQLQSHFKDQGAEIAAFYHCPFLADGKIPAYRLESPLRKPAPGMLLQAARDFDLDLSCCVMVGDKVDDIEAGKRAGCLTMLVRTGQGRLSEAALARTGPGPDHTVDDLLAAARIIAALSPSRAEPD
jgi:D-glycero-D-manno-heptose 1,7-bisphosphate phosphatase